VPQVGKSKTPRRRHGTIREKEKGRAGGTGRERKPDRDISSEQEKKEE